MKIQLEPILYENLILVFDPVHVWTKNFKEDKTFTYKIYIKGTNIKVGEMDLYSKDVYFMSFEIGYFIQKEYQNKGYATKAIQAIVQNFPDSEIYAKCYESNPISIHILEKNGFTHYKTDYNILLLKKMPK